MNNRINKLRFLFVSSYTIPYTAGGGKNAFNFARFIANQTQHRATILTFNRNLKLRSSETLEKVNIKRIPYFNSNLFFKIVSLAVILPCFIVVLLQHDVLIIYGANNIGWHFFILLGKLFGKKVVFRSTMFGDDDISTLVNKRKLTGNIKRWLFSSIDIYFSLHPEFSKSYIKEISKTDKVFESAQGVDITVFKPVSSEAKILLRKKLGLPTDQKIILSTGMLLRRKGYPDIFNAMQQIPFHYLYLIAGEKNLHSLHHYYRHRKEVDGIYQMGMKLLQGNIRFEGFKENVVEYLQCCDYFLINSYKEGLPNVLLEAMACGAVIISRNLPGLNMYLLNNNVNSLIFNNINELINLFNHLDTLDTNMMGINASKTISEKFSFEKVLANLIHKLENTPKN